MLRRGRGLGIDFFHCMSCNACMSLSLFKVHNCREKAMESNCPVCSEFLFDSADSIKVCVWVWECASMSLSRFGVQKCQEKTMESNCPVCSKFLFNSANSIEMCVGVRARLRKHSR